MDKTKYLFKLQLSTYNNQKPFYDVPPLPKSDILESVIFCGSRGVKDDLSQGITYIYLGLKKPLEQKNRYYNLHLFLNLVWLATGLPIDFQQIKTEQSITFKEVFEKFRCKKYYDKDVSYGGLVRDESPIVRVVEYVSLMRKLKSTDLLKFENALNTFIWAKEIGRLPDPHLKYTLFMTLYLASIDQLANDPKECICKTQLVCAECGKDFKKHQRTSHSKEIELLIREMITGKNLDSAIKMVKDLYSSPRSSFLHTGSLSGSEREGGFLFCQGSEIKLVEDMANIEILNRQLLEQFLVKRST